MDDKSIKQKLVYDFFYPGILGSILYEILPYENSILFFLKLSIVLFFSIDYLHLYFFMDKNFSQNKKDTYAYVFGDLLVASLIFVAIRYMDTSRTVVILSIALIPFCFLIYSLVLKFNRLFYILFSVGSFSLATFVILNKDTYVNFDAMVFISVALITTTYMFYVLNQFNRTITQPAQTLNSNNFK